MANPIDLFGSTSLTSPTKPAPAAPAQAQPGTDALAGTLLASILIDIAVLKLQVSGLSGVMEAQREANANVRKFMEARRKCDADLKAVLDELFGLFERVKELAARIDAIEAKLPAE